MNQRKKKRKSCRQTAIQHNDRRAVQIKAISVATIAAIEDFPGDITPTDHVYNVARAAVLLVPRIAHDLGAVEAFCRAFCVTYQTRIERYQQDDLALQRDKLALKQCGAEALARAIVVDSPLWAYSDGA